MENVNTGSESRGRACFQLLVMALDRFSYKAQFETDPAVCCINTGLLFPSSSSFCLLPLCERSGDGSSSKMNPTTFFFSFFFCAFRVR